ncbi:hypothetical protein [Phaeocystidibacter marisrubri]|uniref:Copper chaperone NosL n=1 Tax=Phaeocystidibacter marisrubri TaxID=1577780 RepID=A0A6L3ZGP2_9FLAO|nr:hypothetical protein [Phaeocystidibacter marisrubri]KAB2816587.1 hypothetical protein F8C82_12970 [Phaeocystidibacter marisrubri]
MKLFTPRMLSIVAVLCLSMLYFFPLWEVTLIAPQYPDGVSMYIWIHQITGDTPGTLQNVNILNHYVGMKAIEPDSIPELTYFPYVVAFLMVSGLLAAWVNRFEVYLTFLLVFGILAVLGIYDFYLWEYDYGHDLSPTAPIKVPGMSYQPPLLGEKYLLNFLAKSYPGLGGWAMGLGLALSSLATFQARRVKK